MLFFLIQNAALPNPIIGIEITQKHPCNPLLDQLVETCHIGDEKYKLKASAFVWNNAIWTTQRNIANASSIQSRNLSSTALVVEQKNAIINYAKLSLPQKSVMLTEASSIKKGQKILCLGMDQAGKIQTSEGNILRTNINIQHNYYTAPPLLELDCDIDVSMEGGAVLNESEELIGMLITKKGSKTYALPYTRFQSSKSRIGFAIHEENVLYSVQNDIPLYSEVLGIYRDNQRVSLPLIQLFEEERIRIQLVDDDVWISPLLYNYTSTMLVEETNSKQIVIQPSLDWFHAGVREQDQWFPEQNTPFIKLQRNHKMLFILNPDWWREQQREK